MLWMAMKCWNCGRENDPGNVYCSFCASDLEHPDDRKEPRASAKTILRRMGRIVAIGAFWLAVFIASLTAIVALYNAIRGTELLGGLGVMFTGAGASVSLISMLTLGRIPERYVATRGTRYLAAGVFHNTMFRFLWKTMTNQPSGTEIRLSAALTFVGFTTFIIGLFLL